jgi:hypothetical protein
MARTLRPVALAGLALGVWLLTPGSVPLYDGVGFPDQPYRFVDPPAGVKHGPPPTPAKATAPAVGGQNSEELALQSNEQGPQILLDLPSNSVHVPVGATTVTMTGTPLAPDTQPADGRIDGNVYRLAVTSNAGPASFASTVGDSFLYLRAVTLKPAPPVMEYRQTPQAQWRPLKTGRGGADVFVVAFHGSGDYALVHQRGAKSSKTVSQETLLLLLLGGFVVLVLVAAVLSRRSHQEDAES